MGWGREDLNKTKTKKLWSNKYMVTVCIRSELKKIKARRHLPAIPHTAPAPQFIFQCSIQNEAFYKSACAPSEASSQSTHLGSVNRVFAVRLKKNCYYLAPQRASSEDYNENAWMYRLICIFAGWPYIATWFVILFENPFYVLCIHRFWYHKMNFAI